MNTDSRSTNMDVVSVVRCPIQEMQSSIVSWDISPKVEDTSDT